MAASAVDRRVVKVGVEIRFVCDFCGLASDSDDDYLCAEVLFAKHLENRDQVRKLELFLCARDAAKLRERLKEVFAEFKVKQSLVGAVNGNGGNGSHPDW